MLYACVVCVSELSDLNLDDVNYKDCLILVRGKGKKERLAPFGQYCHRALEAYLKERAALTKPNSGEPRMPLFLNHSGTRLTTRSVPRPVEKYYSLCGLRQKLSHHGHRHPF